MEFFKQLYDITDGMDITFHVKRKNDKLTMSILPGTVNKVQPVIITGTAEELEEGFFTAIAKPVTDAKGLTVDTSAFDESVEKAAKKEAPKPAEKVTTKKKEKKPVKKAEVKTKVKEPKKVEPPKTPTPQPASLF